MSQRYGTSIYAALRRYGETHPGAVAAIVLGSTPYASNPLRWQRDEFVATKLWKEKMGAPKWPQSMSSDDYPFLAAFHIPELDEIQMTDAGGGDRNVEIGVLNNGYRSFVLLWLPQPKRLVPHKKVRIAQTKG